ncbi:molybdate ABC transporter substrate-binding protein [Alkalicoccus daliensis]|uniref:Molybdate transport system substrate-binding protein n=1 Tax=Alkalicoccus daliensis TaxID=745820 RepID=A0A1H0CKN9_9BACI|nr:molybdate ABC transporter substrate-binding protein [Alkalicoccus daliensis]SDN58460.1 molybdate transport system substrate-binding protein [Alkalicoccus daliensis]
MKKLFLFGVPGLLLTGCGNAEEAVELHIAAASDLYHAFSELGENFEAEYNIEIVFSFGSTGQLTQQIEQGADFDIFAAAHESYIDRLIESEDVLEDSRQLYAEGSLGFLYDEEMYDSFSPKDLLSEDVQQIAIANPGHAPYGKAAQEALETWDMWGEIEEKLVYANNIREALQFVETGNVDVGIVATALSMQSELSYTPIDSSAHEPLLQALAVPVRSEHPEEAALFIEYLFSEEGQDVMEAYGFVLPEEE